MIDVRAESFFEHLGPVGLTRLESTAALQTRVDHKYLVPRRAVAEVAASLDPSTKVLEVGGARSLRYETVYFDTSNLDAYHASARSRPRRFKVRTRSYLDSGVAFLEVKVRERTGLTVKHRLPYPPEDAHTLTGLGRDLLSEFDSVAPVADSLMPTLTVTYQRTTLLEPETKSRITIDTAVEASTPSGTRIASGPNVIIETKTTVPPTVVDRCLWSLHHRPVSFSKYCTLMAAIDESLPANKWHRTLSRYFDWRDNADLASGGPVESRQSVPQQG